MNRICNDCGSPFTISERDRRFYEQRKILLPCRCVRCRLIDRPQLWYVNRETLAVESVSVLEDAEKIKILYRGKAYTLDPSVLGTRLYRTQNEAWLASRRRKR